MGGGIISKSGRYEVVIGVGIIPVYFSVSLGSEYQWHIHARLSIDLRPHITHRISFDFDTWMFQNERESGDRWEKNLGRLFRNY